MQNEPWELALPEADPTHANPTPYALQRVMQSIFRPAARRQNLEGRRNADRRDGGLKMDWTKPLHNAPSYGR